MPGVGPGARYKFSICGPDGVWREKADPMAALAETPPATASVVYQSEYEWADDDWLAERAERQPLSSPMSVYEVHLGSWRPGLSYRELAGELAAYVTDMGFTHVEFLPVAEHPFGGSWGYQVTSYYAPTSRFGTPDDFRFLVDTLHQAGIGVIVDWVPAHFPRDSWALAEFDGTHLYEHSDPRLGSHPDWGTLVFNFGRSEVRNFLVANAIYWLEEFHIDGLRVDAVASMLYLDYSRKDGEWMPNVYGGRENLRRDLVPPGGQRHLLQAGAGDHDDRRGVDRLAGRVAGRCYLGGLGFGFKWNMGWMNDTLEYMKLDPIYRQYHHNEITFSMVYAFSENYVLPLSHDEVVHGKGSLLRQDAGRRVAPVRRAARAVRLHVGAPGQAAAVHGLGVRPGQRVVGDERPGLVGAPVRLPLRRAAPGPRPERDLQGAAGAVVAGHARRTASPGSTPTTRTATCCRSCASARRSTGCRCSPASPTSPRCRTPTTGSACRWPAAGARCSTPTPTGYGGSGMGNLGAVHADPQAVARPARVGVDRAAADVGSLADPGDLDLASQTRPGG